MEQRFPTEEFLGVGLARCSVGSAADWVIEAGRSASFAYLVTPNVDHVVMINEDGEEDWRKTYREAVRASDLCVNDSRILARLARISGKSLGLVPGSDLVRTLLTEHADKPASVALVGGDEREAEWLRKALPDARVSHNAPPMGVRDDPAIQGVICEFVERERADWVFLAIGAPQSELVAKMLAERGEARGVALCIGASIEFLSGAQKRAPRWMQKAGLEWFYRLAREPSRMWRRYLVRGPRVFAIWARSRTSR